MRLIKSYQRADTIIEVMIAFGIFAASISATLLIMNLGVANAMRSLEVTLVRQQMDSQVEAIRYIHTAYVSDYQKGSNLPMKPPSIRWDEIKDRSTGMTPDQVYSFSENDTKCPAATSDIRSAFFIDEFAQGGQALKIRTGTDIVLAAPSEATLPPYAQIDYSTGNPKAYNMWIQAVPSSGAGATKYVDFHVRACWDSSASTVPVTLGTLVRLYDPKQ